MKMNLRLKSVGDKLYVTGVNEEITINISVLKEGLMFIVKKNESLLFCSKLFDISYNTDTLVNKRGFAFALYHCLAMVARSMNHQEEYYYVVEPGIAQYKCIRKEEDAADGEEFDAFIDKVFNGIIYTEMKSLLQSLQTK